MVMTITDSCPRFSQERYRNVAVPIHMEILSRNGTEQDLFKSKFMNARITNRTERWQKFHRGT